MNKLLRTLPLIYVNFFAANYQRIDKHNTYRNPISLSLRTYINSPPQNPAMKDKHVVVLAFPFGSHAAPLLELIHSIAVSSPGVLFSFFSTSMSNKSLFSNKSYDNIKPYDVDDGLPKDYVFSNNPQEPVELFLKATPRNFMTAMDVVVTETGRKASCLVSDAFLWFAGDIAQEMNVPWVPLWTAAPHSLLVHVETQLIRQKVLPSGCHENQIVEIIPEFSVRAADLPEGVASGDLNSCFAMMLYKMGKALPQATAVAINSFEDVHSRAIDELKSKFHKFLNVGPFTLKAPPNWMSDEHGCLEWLDQQDYASVAYISFGRVITPPPHELIALAEALEESGVPFIWSFRGNAEEKFPKGFLQRTSRKGKILPWATQLLVLAHPSVGVFVTHCGWNSILDSIIAGVPMICRPFFGDQKLNMRTLEKVWGFGVGVEGGVFTKNGAKKALELSLLSEQGKEMREKIRGLTENAYRAVGSDGSSTENFNTLKDIVTK